MLVLDWNYCISERTLFFFFYLCCTKYLYPSPPSLQLETGKEKIIKFARNSVQGAAGTYISLSFQRLPPALPFLLLIVLLPRGVAVSCEMPRFIRPRIEAVSRILRVGGESRPSMSCLCVAYSVGCVCDVCVCYVVGLLAPFPSGLDY